jgi:hypothetical protein
VGSAGAKKSRFLASLGMTSVGQLVLGSQYWVLRGLQKGASSRRAQEKRPPRKAAATKCKEHGAKIGYAARGPLRLISKRSAVEGEGGVALAEDAYSFELTDRSKWFE